MNSPGETPGRTPDPYGAEPGHEWVYRLTAFRDGVPAQTVYYLSPHQARFWRDKLRATGYQAAVARVPAEMFVPLSDRQLDGLAQEERERAAREERPA